MSQELFFAVTAWFFISFCLGVYEHLPEKLHTYSKDELWAEYCGFLNLSTSEFMSIQKRLLLEQMDLWCSSELGQSILKGRHPKTVEEFRSMVPLTTYEDYAPYLLAKKTSVLYGQ